MPSARPRRQSGRSLIAPKTTSRRGDRGFASCAPSTKQVVDRLILALNTGDLQGLMDILAPDVVSVADSGGKVRGAARRPVVGADRLARYLVGGLAKADGAVVATLTRVNGQAAVRMELDGQLVGIASVTVEHGQVTKVYSIANPDKLSRLDLENALSR